MHFRHRRIRCHRVVKWCQRASRALPPSQHSLPSRREVPSTYMLCVRAGHVVRKKDDAHPPSALFATVAPYTITNIAHHSKRLNMLPAVHRAIFSVSSTLSMRRALLCQRWATYFDIHLARTACPCCIHFCQLLDSSTNNGAYPCLTTHRAESPLHLLSLLSTDSSSRVTALPLFLSYDSLGRVTTILLHPSTYPYF